MEIKGFTTPRYLDRRWFKLFSITVNSTSEKDIPVTVIVDDDSFKASQINNDMPSYQELQHFNRNLKIDNRLLLKELKSLHKECGEALEWGDFSGDITHVRANLEDRYYKSKSILDEFNEVPNEKNI